MKNLFVNIETAKQLQEIGLNLPCICGYDSFGLLRSKLASTNEGAQISWDKYDHDIPAPLYQQVINWLAKKEIYIYYQKSGSQWYWCVKTDTESFFSSIDNAIEYVLFYLQRKQPVP